MVRKISSSGTSANPYTNQYFVLRGAQKYFKWSAYRKSLGTTALAPNLDIFFRLAGSCDFKNFPLISQRRIRDHFSSVVPIRKLAFTFFHLDVLFLALPYNGDALIQKTARQNLLFPHLPWQEMKCSPTFNLGLDSAEPRFLPFLLYYLNVLSENKMKKSPIFMTMRIKCLIVVFMRVIDTIWRKVSHDLTQNRFH